MFDHRQAHAKRLSPQELAHLADTIWQSRNAARGKVLASQGTSEAAVALEDSLGELECSVAALNFQKKQQPSKQTYKRTPARKGDSQPKQCKMVCWKHIRFGKKAHSCADEDNCSFS